MRAQMMPTQFQGWPNTKVKEFIDRFDRAKFMAMLNLSPLDPLGREILLCDQQENDLIDSNGTSVVKRFDNKDERGFLFRKSVNKLVPL